jgi:hypothetical protein
VGDDEHTPSGILPCDSTEGLDDPSTKLAVTFAAGPSEVGIRLLQVGRPRQRKSFLHPPDRQSVDAAAPDFADTRLERYRLVRETLGKDCRGAHGPLQWTRINGLRRRLVRQPSRECARLNTASSGQG